ncbi:hypothetical protein RIF29_06277 [Crotalaria pallida]|uniref:TIR domain-containing protein n=1 Tax=Crotalaria pallida TaxID=3830 RepID=A0AAN9PB64_CROPI
MALPSSSFSSPLKDTYKHDVYLSFCGFDTRFGFTGNLYYALSQRGVSTFIDHHGFGEGSSSLLEAIKQSIQDSRMALIIFSKNYAFSSYCLDELAYILECAKGKDLWICPIFYDVGPSEVRDQTGTFGEALAKHEQKILSKEKVQKWRLALRQATDLPAWHFVQQRGEYEYLFVRRIVGVVSRKLKRNPHPPPHPPPPLHVANYPVGLDAHMENVKSLLYFEFDNKATMLGIYGLGGIGKSTIARAIFNSIEDQFEGSCFLANVREESARHGLVQIQETMLSQLVGEGSIKLGDVNHGVSVLKQKLQQKKVLVIVDDVNKKEQLQATAGGLDWFGFGSIIIITTRNKHLLDMHGIEKLYEVNGLNESEALELFRWNAFRNNEVDPSYMQIIKRATDYAGGIPLALEIIGSNLFGKTVRDWKSTLDKYERIPNKDVQQILRVSYDGLEENAKEIFLDIACFFKGCSERYVTSMLHARGFYPEIGMMELKDHSLIKILIHDEDNVVTMHELIRRMGKEIVRQQSTNLPNKGNRLWFHEDIIDILENNMDNDNIEAMMLDMPEDKEVHWNPNDFGKMKSLRMLIVKNVCHFKSPVNLPNRLRVLEWWGHPSASFPFDSLLKNLMVLDLSYSNFEWGKPLEKSKSLRHLILRGCDFITRIPDLSGSPNLTELYVDDCTNLTSVHDSVGFLDKLQSFSAKGCTMLKKIPCGIKLPSLEYLCLRGCSKLDIFPEIFGPMEKLQFVDFEGTAIENLPFSMQNLKGLQSLSLNRCTILSIDILTNMVQNLPTVFPSLKKLRLEGSNLKMIPKSIEKCCLLKDLTVKDSKQLNEITGLPQNITSLNAINCPSLNIHAAATNMVLKKIFEQGSSIKRTFRLGGERLPEWFDLSNKGNSLRFWFRNRIPDITVGVVTWGAYTGYDYYFKINNGFEISCSNLFSHSCFEPEEIFISNDLHAILSSQSTPPLLDEWNYAEISFVQSSKSYHHLIEPVRWSGVYVNRENTSMKDILFTNPYPAVYEHQEMAPEESSQAQGEDDVEMKASYANPDGGARVPSHSHDKSTTAPPSEVAREIAQDFIDNDASILLHPEECRDMKARLDDLSNLSEDDGISRGMITFISEASNKFANWCREYTEATEKIEFTASELSRADKLEAGLKVNKKLFRQIILVESDLLQNLTKMEEEKKKLEEQINAIKADIPSNQSGKKKVLEEQINVIVADISSYQLEKKMVHRRKRGIFEEGKMLKTQRDELRKKKPDLLHEHGLAKETQTKITDEWSKLGENFKKIFVELYT